MRIIIIGCPYTDMRELGMLISKSSSCDIQVINSKDVVAISHSKISTKDGAEIDIGEISRTYIRYPYDLIPPHTATFRHREETEFLKSLCLALDKVAVNPLTKSWPLRNRVYSLQAAKEAGLAVPDFLTVCDSDAISVQPPLHCVKAVGNCFVSETGRELSYTARKYLDFEQEGNGETAYILPASLMTTECAKDAVNEFGATFTQLPIMVGRELRIYLIGGMFFEFLRNPSKKFDKSTMEIRASDGIVAINTKVKINNFASHLGIEYLCMDAIVGPDGQFSLLDINPYGSLPRYSDHPGPTEALAALLVGN